jgi:hypothetical protein
VPFCFHYTRPPPLCQQPGKKKNFQKPLDFLVATIYNFYSNKKGGEPVPAKRGRPASDAPKDYMLRVRMDQETLQQLDECCEAEELSRSEIVRKGIKEQHSRIKK